MPEREHLLSADCWCQSTIETYPDALADDQTPR